MHCKSSTLTSHNGLNLFLSCPTEKLKVLLKLFIEQMVFKLSHQKNMFEKYYHVILKRIKLYLHVT